MRSVHFKKQEDPEVVLALHITWLIPSGRIKLSFNVAKPMILNISRVPKLASSRKNQRNEQSSKACAAKDLPFKAFALS